MFPGTGGREPLMSGPLAMLCSQMKRLFSEQADQWISKVESQGPEASRQQLNPLGTSRWQTRLKSFQGPGVAFNMPSFLLLQSGNVGDPGHGRVRQEMDQRWLCCFGLASR